MNILFLGKYDKNMHSLEEKILNIQKNPSPNQTYNLEYNEFAEPDVKKCPINNCDVWIILGNVKPTLLLKQLISQTNILLFVFNFSNFDTLAFLTEGWGPIVKKAGITKPEYQKRILIGTQCSSSINSKDKLDKIKDAMKNLGCEEFCAQGIRIKNEKFGSYTFIPDLIKYIEEQIPKEKSESSILDKPDENNKNIKNEDLDNKFEKENMKEKTVNEIEKNQSKITIKLKNNIIMNLLLNKDTAEVQNIQNLPNSFIVPQSVWYENKQYIITNICEFAFKDSNILHLSFEEKSQVKKIGNYVFQHSKIQSLVLPASLEILSEFWCAGANDLYQIGVDKRNSVFKNIGNFLINNLTLEILFAPRNLVRELNIPCNIGDFYFINHVSIGNYGFYSTKDLRNIKIYSDEIYIGDFCFSNTSKLNSIEITCTKKLKIGKNCFANCCSLSSISIKNESVDDLIISMDTFYNCKSLVNITIDSKSKLILENDVFSCNKKLEKVNLKGSYVFIGDKCFKDSFTKEEYYQYYYYKNEQIKIYKFLKIESESNVEIGKNCFEACNIDNFEISGIEVSLKEESFSNCSLLTYFRILNATKVLIEEFSFKNCSNLNTISLDEIGFVSIKPHALFGCNELKKFYLKLSLIYDAWNDYDIKQTPLKTGNSNNLFISQKKGTEEFFVFKQLLQENKYNEYLKKFTKQIISLSKNNDLIISVFCGCGLIKLNSMSESYLTIMTRYYNKGSLDDVFSKKVQLSDTQKYILILGITYEMKLLHSYGFSYPNLPPEKILLDENYYPHLNISGYSKQSEPTIYTAPEVLIKKEKRKQSDIYSYSLILYELITGEKPYNFIKSKNDIFQYIENGLRPDSKYVKDKFIQEFLNRCWSNVASYRPSFNEIYNEITNERFISLFDVNEEEIYKYMKLLKIPEFKEVIKSDNISFELFKWSKTAKITKVDNSVENLELPKSYKGEKAEYNIVEICDHAFSHCFTVKNIIIPPNSSIRRIGNYAFEYSSLVNIEINTNQNITIQIETFINCNSLKKVIINSSQSLIISNNCFNKSTIEEFEASGNQVEICNDCFSNSKDFCSLRIASKEKLRIGQNIFNNCISLKTISIINGSNEDLILSAKSFEKCNSLISLEIYNNNSTLIFEKEIFSSKDNLQRINIIANQIIFEEKSFYKSFGTIKTNIQVESQTSIEFKHQSFEESQVENIDIKSKEVHIKEESFAQCFNLTKFDINGSIEVSIEKYAFKDCLNLTSISINEIGYFKIRLNALVGCNKLDKIQLNLTQSFKSSKYYQYQGKPQTNNLSKTYLFIKNETKEKYIAKVFMNKSSNEPWDKYYIKYLDYFLDQIIKISKENIPMLSDVFECGLFRFSQKPYFTIISKKIDYRSLSNSISELSGTQRYIILLGTTIGMQFIVSKKIDHQKLSSEKILLDESYCPILNILDSPELEQVKPNDIKSDIESFLIIFYELLTDNPIKSTNNLNKDIKVKQIKNERIQQSIKILKKYLSYESYKGPTFTGILDEITYVDYLDYFNADNNEIFKYLDLFKIDLKEDIVYNGIHYLLSIRSKTAKIIKISDKNNIQIQNYLSYKKSMYSVTEISDGVFSKNNQSKIIELKIPSSIKIGNKCFEEFDNLYKITFSSPNLNIGYECFYKCKLLNEIMFYKADTLIIGSKSFEGCEKLQYISFPESNRIEFGEKCFSNAKQISSLEFKCQYLSVGSNCFESCDSLKKFSCTASNILFQSQPFNKCNKLEVFSITCKSISKSNENTNEIFEDSFFNDLSLLQNVEIYTDQEITISTKVFYGCNSLTKVKLKSQSSVTLLNKNRFSMNTESFEVIGNQVNLDKNCFYSSKKLQSLKIKCNELNVHDQCFSDCTNLSYVSFDVLTKIKLGSNAFCNCSNLNNFYLNFSYYSHSSKIEQIDIGDHCFSNCKNIESFYFVEVQNGKVGSFAFEECENMIRFNMIVSLNLEIGDYCFLNDKKLANVCLHAENLKVGNFLFENCPSLSSVSLRGSKNEDIGQNTLKTRMNIH